MRKSALVRHEATISPAAVKAITNLLGGLGGAVVGGGQLFMDALAKLAKASAYAGIGIPIAAGATAGLAASKLTSPSRSQLKALEKRIVNANLDEMIAENKRKTEVSQKQREMA